MNTSILIGNKLKTTRQESKLTQDFVANNIKLTQSQVSKIERGDLQADYDTLIALAKLYNISLDKLFLN